MNRINPEIAAHNIAKAFCEHQISKMPDENFEPGDLRNSKPSAEEMWRLYANTYDFVFEAALQDNIPSIDEE